MGKLKETKNKEKKTIYEDIIERDRIIKKKHLWVMKVQLMVVQERKCINCWVMRGALRDHPHRGLSNHHSFKNWPPSSTR